MKNFKQFITEAKKYKAYHGTNNIISGKFKIGTGEEGWFTDDIGYAFTQGDKVYEATLMPKKVLNKNTAKKITADDITKAIYKLAPNLDPKNMNRILKISFKNIDKYIQGKMASNQIFVGMGDVEVLQALGFDMEEQKNPYDRTGDSHFYRVYNSDIIKGLELRT